MATSLKPGGHTPTLQQTKLLDNCPIQGTKARAYSKRVYRDAAQEEVTEAKVLALVGHGYLKAFPQDALWDHVTYQLTREGEFALARGLAAHGHKGHRGAQ